MTSTYHAGVTQPKLLAISFAYPPLAYPRSIQVSRLLNNIKFETTLICADDAPARRDARILREKNGNFRQLIRVPFRTTALERLQNKVTYRLTTRLWNSRNRMPDQYGTWKQAVFKTLNGL